MRHITFYVTLVGLLSLGAAGREISTASDVAAHVPTGVYCCHGYSDDTVPVKDAVPYVTWATTDASARADRDAGIENVVQYLDSSRVYVGDHAYPLVDGGKYAAARAVNCSGQPVRTASPPGYVIDPFNPLTRQLLDEELVYHYDPAYTHYFLDDVDAIRWEIKGGPMCTGSPPAPFSEPATAKAYADLLGSLRIDVPGRTIVPKILLNGLSEYDDKPDLHLTPMYAMAPLNVIGGMCEGCFADNRPDVLKGGTAWQDDLDIELRTIRLHKIFWLYVKYIANDPNARLYTFASYMLLWDPEYTIYQTAYKPNNRGQLHITPETGIVARDPVKTQIASIFELRDLDGTYVREYRSCSYRRKAIGPCAFVVNSDNLPHSRPKLRLGYRHSVTISGGMVLEGGTLSVYGPEPPLMIPPMRGYIFTR